MNKIAILILSIAMVSCGQQGTKTENETSREVKQYTIGQFYKNLKVYGGSFSPDENNLLVSSNKTGIFNVFF